MTKTVTKDTRPSKGGEPTVTKVATAPAHGATDKAPHTKRAVAENAAATKLAKAEKTLADAKAAVTVATATATKAKGAARKDAFTAKAAAELAVIAANKAVNALKREAMTPEERAATAKPAKAATKTPRVAVNRTISKGSVVYANAKGGWTFYMVTLTLKHKDTDSATAAHKDGAAKAGYPATKPLDFKWMDAKGYIKLG